MAQTRAVAVEVVRDGQVLDHWRQSQQDLQVDQMCVWAEEEDGSHHLPERLLSSALTPQGRALTFPRCPLPLDSPAEEPVPSGGCSDLPSRRAHCAGSWDDKSKGRLRDSLHTIHRGPRSLDHARENDSALSSDSWSPAHPLGAASCGRISYFPLVVAALTAEENTGDG